MSKSNRRPASNSRGNSSSGHRSLSVTEAVQSIRLTETVGEYPASRRRPSARDTPTSYEPSPYGSSTLDPSVLDSYPTATRSSYPGQSSSTANSHPSISPTMSGYPAYTQAPALTNPYNSRNLHPRSTSTSTSPYGKPTFPIASPLTPSNRRRLNEVGYSNPSTGASMSRSMSGPSLPSMPPSAYEEIRNLGREFVDRRRVPINRPRHERKIRMRQATLSSTLRPLQVQDGSDSIDSFLAHSTSSFDSPTPYASHGGYPGSSTRTSTSYDDPSPYTAPYTSSGSSSVAYPSTTRGYSGGGSTNTAYDHFSTPRQSSHSGHSHREPVVLETPKKSVCWDHNCNGRQFSTFSNLLRHQREKSGASSKAVCHRCGAEFTRKTARDAHLAHDKCKQKTPPR